MTDREFNEQLQSELKRVNDQLRDAERQIFALQAQAEKMMEKLRLAGISMEDAPPPMPRRRKPYYA